MYNLPDWLTESEQTALSQFASALHERYNGDILAVRLFGSKARGDFGADSDLDVFVLVNEGDWRFEQAVNFLAADISLEHDVVLMPKVVTAARWESLSTEGLAIVSNVQREGIDLLTAPIVVR